MTDPNEKNNPEGCCIGSSNKPWQIGKMLGKGACGSVHEIERLPSSSSSSTTSKMKASSANFVIKIAPMSNSAAKGKKRKKTAMERNADLLLFENTLYRNVFNNMTGRWIPDIPMSSISSKEPPGFGEFPGFRYLVMERMSAPFFHIVKAITKNMKETHNEKIQLGDIAKKMVECIQKLHENRYVYVDVKPENFMLARSTKRSAEIDTIPDLVNRIRLIDFGLVETFHDMALSGHREDNFPGSEFAGTPMYASVNVLEGHTPSRRDDLEALLYILSEMVLMLIEHKTDETEVLPWSIGTSDEEILNIKKSETQLNDDDSSFFQRLSSNGNDMAKDVIKNALTLVRNIRYNEKPKYEKLFSILEGLDVSISEKKTFNKRTKIGKKQSTKPVKNCSIKRSREGISSKARKSDKSSTSETQESVIESNTKAKNEPVRSTRRSKRIALSDTTTNTISQDEISLDEEIVDLTSDDDFDENGKMTRKKIVSPYDSTLQMTFIEGPHKGASFVLGESKVIIGRDPVKVRKKKRIDDDETYFTITNDPEVSSSHLSLILHSKKRGSKTLNSVKVTDLVSTNGTYVNGKILSQGESRQAFAGEKIQLGTSVIHIKKNVSK